MKAASGQAAAKARRTRLAVSMTRAALDVRLHISRRHQLYLMPQGDQLTRPVMRRRAGFNAHKTGLQGFEKLDDFGYPERHEYELYLAVEDIDHTRTKARSPQTNGIVERFHKTMLDEFYRIAFRKKVYAAIDELQADLDAWMREFNETWPHQGSGASARRRCKHSLTPCRWRVKNQVSFKPVRKATPPEATTASSRRL